MESDGKRALCRLNFRPKTVSINKLCIELCYIVPDFINFNNFIFHINELNRFLKFEYASIFIFNNKV